MKYRERGLNLFALIVSNVRFQKICMILYIYIYRLFHGEGTRTVFSHELVFSLKIVNQEMRLFFHYREIFS